MKKEENQTFCQPERENKNKNVSLKPTKQLEETFSYIFKIIM